ncbi:hypothetical protein [Larkinella terrae]|uniref:Lipoprotein n=1 Tax=Larkinella terrae TaxID=2025311 RepID=A0A7K0EU17_9BACT|nr:hypothetical protein [Larkinella terrae]MRS65304.1 hypothetical protein [Larkinella terrae]
MQKPPKATAMGWLGVYGLVVMLAMSACESVAVEPAPAETRPAVRVPSNADDTPDRPGKPPGK